MDSRTKAYTLALEAGKADFAAAVQGLLAGHAAQIEELTCEIARKDAALLASLAISGKGAPVGAGDGLAKVVCDGLTRGTNAAPIERDFLAQHDSR